MKKGIKEWFPDELRGKFIARNQWAVIRDFRYNSPKFGLITVPCGFITDGASIPSILWGIIGSPWAGDYPEAAVIHDWVYTEQSFKRSDCDKIFLEGMGILGVNWFKRRIMYRAVRTFGWIPWKNKAYKKEKDKEPK